MNKSISEKKEAVRQFIVRAVPSVMDLKMGCLVKEKVAFGSAFRGYTYNGGDIFPCVGFIENVKKYVFIIDGGFCYVPESQLTNWHEIIGRPITLADVLAAIGSGYAVTALGDFIEVHNGGAWEFPGTTTIYKWDLSQDFDHQSEETIDFLWSLLCE